MESCHPDQTATSSCRKRLQPAEQSQRSSISLFLRERAYRDPALVHSLGSPSGIKVVELDDPVKGVCNVGRLVLKSVDTTIFEVREDVGLNLRLAQISGGEDGQGLLAFVLAGQLISA